MNDDLKVLLLVPFIDEKKAIYKNSTRGLEVLALSYLSSFLNSKGINNDVLNAQLLRWTPRKILSSIDLDQYHIVGISCSAQRLFTYAGEIARNIKKKNRNIYIVMGGWFASIAHKELLNEINEIDAVVRGEGEFTLYEIVQRFPSRDLSGILGVSYRNDGIVVNPDRPRIKDLDVLPFPARNDFKEIFKSIPQDGYYAPIMASRGCYAHCSYCSINSLFHEPGRIIRSPSNVVKEMLELKNNHGISKYYFVDEIFLDSSRKSEDWIKSFCEEIKRNKLNIKYLIYCRSNDVKHETFKLLKESGLHTVYLGVESGSQKALDRYNKKTKVKSNTAAVQLLRDLGIDVKIGFIMIDPESNFEEIIENFNWLSENQCFKIGNLTNKLNIYFGTPLVKRLEENGLIKRKISIADRFCYHYKDHKVKYFSDCIDHIKEIMDSFDESFYYLKSMYNQLKIHNNAEDIISSVNACINTVERKEKVIWTNAISRLISRIQNERLFLPPHDIYKEIKNESFTIKKEIDDFMKDKSLK